MQLHLSCYHLLETSVADPGILINADPDSDAAPYLSTANLTFLHLQLQKNADPCRFGSATLVETKQKNETRLSDKNI
jgi:hypothetical protein